MTETFIENLIAQPRGVIHYCAHDRRKSDTNRTTSVRSRRLFTKRGVRATCRKFDRKATTSTHMQYDFTKCYLTIGLRI